MMHAFLTPQPPCKRLEEHALLLRHSLTRHRLRVLQVSSDLLISHMSLMMALYFPIY